MTIEEAIRELNLISKKYPNEKEDCLRVGQTLSMATEALKILDFAEKELIFAVEHSMEEEKDHYQRALNLITNKENLYRLGKELNNE